MSVTPLHRLVLAATLTIAPSAFCQDPATLPGSPPQPQSPSQTQNTPNAAANAGPSGQQNSSPAPGMTGEEMKDKIFLRKAAEGGIAEVKLGQLASEKASSPDVKSFGAKMVIDHTMLNNEMKPIADSMGVRLPKQMNKMDQAEYDKLSSLSGEDFDKEYVTDMVKDHRNDLREFRTELNATQDTTLKAAVEKGEAVIREHAQMITKIAKDKGISVPGRPQQAGVTPTSSPQ